MLYILQIIRCKLIHTKIADEVEVKEFQDLKQEFELIIESEVCSLLIEVGKIKALTNSMKVTVTQMRGWLFQFYSEVEDYESYDFLNKNTMNFK